MTSSVCFGLALVCLTMLPFFIVLAHPQHHVTLHDRQGPGHVIPTCCETVSNATIRGPVSACFEQKKNRFPHCKVHAYIFVNGEDVWCVDARAWWIPQRLERLKKRGIYCQVLSQRKKESGCKLQ